MYGQGVICNLGLEGHLLCVFVLYCLSRVTTDSKRPANATVSSVAKDSSPPDWHLTPEHWLLGPWGCNSYNGEGK